MPNIDPARDATQQVIKRAGQEGYGVMAITIAEEKAEREPGVGWRRKIAIANGSGKRVAVSDPFRHIITEYHPDPATSAQK